MKGSRIARGQSLVEFALVLPAFLLVGLMFLQLCVLGVRWWQLNSVASTAVRQAAAANGETGAVDASLLSSAAASGLDAKRLQVEIDTDAGAGRLHESDQSQNADAPPPAGYGGTVLIRLTYREPLIFNMFGVAVSLGASFSQESTGAYGGLTP